MKIFYQIIILTVFFNQILFSQEVQEDVLVKFDDRQITSTEFTKRFELTPRVRSSANIDTQKIHFLYTLIAEKLWAKEAHQQNLDTLKVYKEYVSNLEKMLVRDALFKKEIDSKVNISEEDLNEGINRKQYALRVKFLFSKSKDEIDSLYNLLKTTSIDSILQNRTEKQEQEEAIKVEFGQMKPELEDSLYNLKIGEYTKPIFNEIGWAIYYLTDKIELSGPQLGDQQNVIAEVKETLKNKQKMELMNEYLSKLLSDVNVNADGDLFRALANQLFRLLSNKQFPENTTMYFLYENDLIGLINSIPPDLKNKPFIKFEQNSVSLIDFVYYLYFNNFKSSGVDLSSVQAALNNAVSNFIRLELIAREGYKQNLQLLPEIQNELAMWKDNFLSQYLRNTYNQDAKVTDRELESYISQLKDSTVTTKYVSITEVKMTNLDQAQSILYQLQMDENFDEIIQRMNNEVISVEKNDTLKPISSFPEYAQIIEGMSEGEIYGPIIRSFGYSIIKLNKIEKKSLSLSDQNNFQIDSQRETLFYKKLENILTDKTIEFAEKYNVGINENVLNKIEVTTIPSLIYRYYGFGGQTVAAPFTSLFYKWFYKYQKSENEAL